MKVGDQSIYIPLAGCELVVEDKGRRPGYLHILQFFICRDGKIVNVPSVPEFTVRAPVDPNMVLLPMYRGRSIYQPPALAGVLGYLSTPRALGGEIVHMPGLQDRSSAGFQRSRVPAIVPQFLEEACQHFGFRASEWPANVEKLQATISDAIDMFVHVLEAGPASLRK